MDEVGGTQERSLWGGSSERHRDKEPGSQFHGGSRQHEAMRRVWRVLGGM